MRPIGTKWQFVHQLRIADREKLQGVFRELLEQHETHRRTAAWLGIEQSTFTRLLNGKTKKAISQKTYASVCRAFGGDPSRYGERPLGVTPFAAEPLDQEVEQRARRGRPPGKKDSRVAPEELEAAKRTLWSEAEQEAAIKYDLYERFVDSIFSPDERWVRDNYERWLERELSRLDRVVGDVMRELREIDEVDARFRNFVRDEKRKEELESHEKRLELALYRTVEPLADAEPTWGVERSWRELHEEGRLLDYIIAALERERHLLRGREREQIRFRQARAPMTYEEYLDLDAARDHFFEDYPQATEADWQARIQFFEANPEATEAQWRAHIKRLHESADAQTT